MFNIKIISFYHFLFKYVVFGLCVEEDEVKRNNIVQMKNDDYVVQIDNN